MTPAYSPAAYAEISRLLSLIHEGLFITDGAGTILSVSKLPRDVHGLSDEELIGRNVFELEEKRIFNPSVTAAVLRQDRKVTLTQKGLDGRSYVVTGVPIRDGVGRIDRVVSFFRDVTDYAALKANYEHLEEQIFHYSAELRELRAKELGEGEIVANSPQMEAVLRTAGKVAAVDANVTISGESGVGKNLLARHIHKTSGRREGPFIDINCGAIPENLLESELFGYEPGAFTGASKKGKIGTIELANRGTLFLDEIGELPLALQVKLLRVIQEKTLTRIGGTREIRVDFRLVAATNRDLDALVKSGRFREDLFYRLNVIPLHIPALRERPDDILPLLMHFLKLANQKYAMAKTLSSSCLEHLLAYRWPGNVREMQNLLERLVVTADEQTIHSEQLPADFRLVRGPGLEGGTLAEAKERLEAELVRRAYARTRSCIGVAAALGISHASATRKLRKHVPGY
ncbi:RNA polymerase subunit sigma-54 [Desulfuromonas versatilis]|uniref:RNA polymerase subunit sigma-54 n=1 Tax=Desulfuromonas versatilis TaxID=2802975 RepID=A0ABN6DW57_9BACT|nr:sigma 54-interacting transcriptional regulator [Desulfuromonas versatilis]BCR04270.1 RNA polymerase subunit sigma-54 [Desulfuromonas versatilis]